MTRTVRRVVVFVVGLLLILLGLVLIVLPGPLTIPPIVLGVWLWSREFAFADRWLAPVREKGALALDHARRAPIRTGLVTVLGLATAVAALWTALSYDLFARAKDLVGIG